MLGFSFEVLIAGIIAVVSGFIMLLTRKSFDRIEDLAEEQKQEIAKRRRKLEPFLAPMTPLYFNDELLTSLYYQRSATAIDTIKETATHETSQRVDVKIASTGTKGIESRERILKETKSKESKYEAVLEWLCEKNRIIIGLEKYTIDEDSIIKDIEPILKRRYSDPLSERVKEAMVNGIVAWNEMKQLSELESSLNKFILLKQNFSVDKPSNGQFHLFFGNNTKFHIFGESDYCTEIGRSTFVEDASVSVGVFGLVSDVNKDSSSLFIVPIAMVLPTS